MVIALVFIIIIGIGSSLSFYIIARLKGKLEHITNELEFLRQEKKDANSKIEFFQQKNLDFEKQNELLKQERNQLEKYKTEWNKDKENILLKLSNDLLKKNIEHQSQNNVTQQENIKKITENLFKNFENLTTKVVSLNDEVKKSSEAIDLTNKALLSPKLAGRSAEITLENILKNSGLKEKSNLNSVGDYILQSHFLGLDNNSEHKSKRPDAILFFPNDQIAVIDSKSSVHFLDLELARQNNDEDKAKAILTKIKESFKAHLENLKKRNYSRFLSEEMRQKNATDYKILVIMFLQTEQMMEVLRNIDSNFEQKALESGVIIASPIGLINFLSQARIVIDRVKQEKNVENLKIEVQKLLDNVAVIFNHSRDLGKSLNRALVNHNKMTSSLNRGVYSKIKTIADLGIKSKKSSEINLLENYDINEES